MATDELLCDKNAGAWVSMLSYLEKQIKREKNPRGRLGYANLYLD